MSNNGRKSIDLESNFTRTIVNIKRSKVAYVLLILGILPRVIWMLKNKLPSVELLGFDFNRALDISKNGIDLLHWNILKAFFLISIFLVISMFEFLGTKDIRMLSLARTRVSAGNKFADLYYYIISFFAFKFRSIAIFATLGLAQLSDSFGSLINNFYSVIVPEYLNISLYPMFIVALLLSELEDYTSHRISHTFFWELHEFHHSATEMTILNVKRNSILGEVIPAIPAMPFLLLSLTIINKALSEGQWAIFFLYVVYEICGELFGYIGHSSTKITFPKPFSYLFMSPSLHWLHHSSNPKHFNKNFGSVLTVWDRVFGTYLDETHLSEIKSFGLVNSEYNKYHPLYCYFILPARKLIKKYRRKFIGSSI